MRESNRKLVRLTFESAGVEFIPENGGGAGVRLRKRAAAGEDHPRPVGPATDVVDAMDAAIEGDKVKRKRPAAGAKPKKGTADD